MEDRISSFLPFQRFLPAVSQGAIGIQIRSEDERVAHWVDQLEHTPTRIATLAERALLRTLEGGCHVPVGGFGEVKGTALELKGVICSLDGLSSVEGEISGSIDDPEALGLALAKDLLERGGEAILEGIRKAGGER
jgi:hydroxymethylbilane synthase